MRCRRARNELRVGSRPRAVTPPPIRYAENGDVHIAYQVVGDGPLDLVCVMGAMTNLHVLWDDPDYRRFCERLASFSRLILFDKRGMGLSDRVQSARSKSGWTTCARSWTTSGSESAALMGVSEGGPMSILFAATYPERTRALVLCGAEVKEEKTDDWPWGENDAGELRGVRWTSTGSSSAGARGTRIDYFAPSRARRRAPPPARSAAYRCESAKPARRRGLHADGLRDRRPSRRSGRQDADADRPSDVATRFATSRTRGGSSRHIEGAR